MGTARRPSCRRFRTRWSGTGLPNLLLDPDVARELNERTAAWRRVVVIAIGYGVATPALAGSLSYFDSYRTESLPANLTQAQRDFFGGHTSRERIVTASSTAHG